MLNPSLSGLPNSSPIWRLNGRDDDYLLQADVGQGVAGQHPRHWLSK